MHVARYTTAEVSAENRLNYWNQLTSDFFPGMVVDGDDTIRASWHSVRLGATHICVARSDRSRVRRWQSGHDIRDSGRALFHLQCKGISNTIQGNNSVVAASGEMAVCMSDEPYGIDISHHNQCLVIDCPESAVPFKPLLGSVVSSKDNPHLRLLLNFATTIFQMGWDCERPNEEEGRHLETALYSLLRNCIIAHENNAPVNPEQSGPKSASETYQQMVGFIDDHISDSHLRTGMIAKKLGIPEFLIQKSFAQFGMTPTAFIISRRLEKAKEQLLNPRFDGSLTDLAYDLGFSDSAHFSRKFKAHFNITPSEFRRQQFRLLS